MILLLSTIDGSFQQKYFGFFRGSCEKIRNIFVEINRLSLIIYVQAGNGNFYLLDVLYFPYSSYDYPSMINLLNTSELCLNFEI